MAAGDIEVYTASIDDDGTKLDTALTGNSIASSDRIAVSRVSGNKVAVVVVKSS